MDDSDAPARSTTMKNMHGSDAVRHTADQWNMAATLLSTATAPAGREAHWAEALAFLGTSQHRGAHLVASVLVVDADGLVLLARHRRYGKWGPLGGHLDPDDANLCAAAARELVEEAGLVARVNPTPIDVHLSSYPCRTAAEPVPHLDVQFVAFASASTPDVDASEELTKLGWFGTPELPYLTPAAAELVDRARAAATSQR